MKYVKNIKKDLLYFVLVCGITSALIYYFTENITVTISVWAIYGFGLFSGKILYFVLSKFMSQLHADILVSWFMFLIISASAAAVDYYLVTPLFQQALRYPLPLSFSPLAWVSYAFILIVFTCNHYTSFKTCNECRGTTPRYGNYCASCGVSLQIEKEEEMSGQTVEL